MRTLVFTAAVSAIATVGSADAGILTYSAQELTAGISSGGVGDEATYTGFDPWYGSRARSEFGFLQFASIGSSLMDNQFSVTATTYVNASSPGYGGYDAYAMYELDFAVTEDAFATIYVDVGREMTQGSILSLAVSGPAGNIYATFIPDETAFTITMAAGEYRLIGLAWTIATTGGDFMNESYFTVSLNAVAVPGPSAFAAFGLLGVLAGRNRRR